MNLFGQSLYDEELLEQIGEKRSLLKTDRLDMSFGEIVSNYEENALVIDPEYQRTFRWGTDKQTRFIESLLLGIPIPPIFVADYNGKWELIDGVQRVSTILSFLGKLKKGKFGEEVKNNFKLERGEILTKIEGYSFNDLPYKLQMTIKRFVCRVEILQWDTNQEMKYHLFNRLNTGGEPLTQQEIRNCIYRGDFNNLVNEMARNKDFIAIINPSETQEKQMYLSELILRYFAVFTHFDDLKLPKGGSIQAYLTKFASKQMVDNSILEAQQLFFEAVKILKIYTAENKQSLFRKNQTGVFNNNFYDAVMYLLSKNSEYIRKNLESSYQKISNILEDQRFIDASGANTYATERLYKKIELIEKMFNE
ncbi:MAG TPA: DUF262 domain-containing protein [Candidatus Helicobacter avistercoris]|nr:DUF262 domain-containing protein [Candidatus Helicobacter avistercoris]